MPLAKSTKGVKRQSQGAQWADHSGDGGNIKYLPSSGATDKSGKKAPTGQGNKGREIARKGRA